MTKWFLFVPLATFMTGCEVFERLPESVGSAGSPVIEQSTVPEPADNTTTINKNEAPDLVVRDAVTEASDKVSSATEAASAGTDNEMVGSGSVPVIREPLIQDMINQETQRQELNQPKLHRPELEKLEKSVSPDPGQSVAEIEVFANQFKDISESVDEPVAEFCKALGAKLGSISNEDCAAQGLRHSAYTLQQRSLAYKDYQPVSSRRPLGRVLLIGGIHGDEYASVSVVFKWMNILNQHHSGMFHWRFLPTANPDGLLRKKSQRQNHRGVDLNRNFPSADWNISAHAYWEETAYRNPRRNPGPAQASEIETQWIVHHIEEFDPDVIISMHAPHHLVDYDGPPTAPSKLGSLNLKHLGIFPGSLGNYAGVDLKLPVVTVELKSAGIMPSTQEIDMMWNDLVQWLTSQLAATESVSIEGAASQQSPVSLR